MWGLGMQAAGQMAQKPGIAGYPHTCCHQHHHQTTFHKVTDHTSSYPTTLCPRSSTSPFLLPFPFYHTFILFK